MEKQDQSLEIGFVDRACEPRHKDFIRLVHWNIEKGKRWPLLEKCLDDESIQSADVVCLNEADHGMARSGNRHVAFEMAERLGMRAVYDPTFYEFTKGTGDERLAAGENSASLHGNAILTRLPVVEYRSLPLPSCYDAFHSAEKRAGNRAALIVRLRAAKGFCFTLAATHLEVLTTRRCRSKQLGFLLGEIGDGPAIVAGDLNTNTFDRGSLWRTAKSLIHLLGPSVRKRVAKPWESEPLFDLLKGSGFTWDQFNDCRATCVVDLSSLDDRKHLPGFVAEHFLRRHPLLPLRLDWIACRGFRAVNPGRTIVDLPAEPSDHLPITADLAPVS